MSNRRIDFDLSFQKEADALSQRIYDLITAQPLDTHSVTTSIEALISNVATVILSAAQIDSYNMEILLGWSVERLVTQLRLHKGEIADDTPEVQDE